MRKSLFALSLLCAAAFALVYAACTPVEGDIDAIRKEAGLVYYTVTFKANGGTPAPAPQTVKKGDKAAAPEGVARTDHTLEGWYTEAAFKNRWDFAKNTVAGDITLYAKWNVNYTIAYIKFADDAAGTMANSIHIYDVPRELNPNGYTRPGYTFMGWAGNSNLPGEVEFADREIVINKATTPGAEVQLYAVWSDKVYTARYDKNALDAAGTMANSTFLIDVPKNLPPNGFTRAGYTFAGWNTQDNGQGTSYTNNQSVVNLAEEAGTTVTLYAQWAADWEVSFVANGGSSINPNPALIPRTSPTAVSQPSPPTRTGYTFAGWYSNAGLTAAYNFSSIVNGDITLYAKWDPIAYTVAYNANGGTGTMNPNPSVHTYDEPKNLPPNGFTRAGYTFAGWNTQANGQGTNYTNSQSVVNLASTAGATVTLYAQWNPITYTVVYNANGGTGTMNPNPSVHTYDEPKNLPPNGFTRDDYTFAGWARTLTGAVEFANGASVSNLTAGETVTLFAQWTTDWVVAFVTNGGSSINPVLRPPLTTVSQPSPSPTRAGYTFAGWYSNAGLTTQYNFSSPVNGNIILYAKWNPITYTVAYNANGGTGTMANSSHTYDVPQNLRTPNTFTRVGYTFADWNTRADGQGTSYTNSQSVSNLTATAGETVTLFAQWAADWVVTFEADGGSSINTVLIPRTPPTAVSRPPDPTRLGYTFAGWFSDAGLTTAYNFSSNVTSNITLYAKWSLLTYTVVYNANGGTGTMANSSHTYNVEKALNANTFTRRSYAFAGWNTRADGQGTSYTNSQTVSNLAEEAGATVTLFAQWGNKITNITNVLPGATLAAQLTWLQNNAISDTNYTVTVSASESISSQTLSYSGFSDVGITMNGNAAARTVSFGVTNTGILTGVLFTVDSGVTLTLGSNIILQGHGGNNSPLVRVNSGGTLVMNSGSHITGNTSTGNGGGVYVDSGTLTMNGTAKISGNNATSSGGVYLTGANARFTMSGGEITGNNATSVGGGVRVYSSGTFTMSGGAISGNTANYGGGVVPENGTFTMSGGTISGNTATSGGGGVYVNNSGTFTMNSGTIISGNKANYGGGVDVGSGTFTMNGGTIGGTSSSSQNTATNSGGGVRTSSSNSTFTMNSGTISGNKANYGGGVDVGSGTFIMKGGTIGGTTSSSRNEADVGGGGVGVGSTGTFTMSGGTVSNNKASYGGGVNVAGTFAMSGGTVSSNTSSGGAGGVNVAGGTFEMSGTAVISGNTSTNGSGGGVYLNNSGTFTMNGGTIGGTTSSSKNTATGYGGGVGAENGTFTMSGTAKIIGNEANSGGGGVNVGGNGTFIMKDNGTISGNATSGGGGGVRVWGIFTMEGGTIGGTTSSSKNTATGDGGGVCMSGANTKFTMSGTAKIIGNEAKSGSNGGGGVYVGSGTFEMSGTAEISGNTASSSFGGGVVILYGKFTMNGTAKISGNTASTYGGGVFANSDGTFTMSGGTISGNEAKSGGGGVYVGSYNGTFIKTGGTIYGYSAGNTNSNAVKNSSGTVQSNQGHAVYVNSSPVKRRETTAGTSVNMDSRVAGTAGGWEN